MAFDYKSKSWQKLRLTILRRDGYRCTSCGCECYGKKRNSGRPVVDHIIPVKQRPDLAMVESNLRVLCGSCDNKRHREKGMVIKQDNVSVGLDGMPEGGDW